MSMDEHKQREFLDRFMKDRGLGYDHTQPNQMAEQSLPTDLGYVAPALPWDYEARAEALRCAIAWTGRGAGVGMTAKGQTLQRALDFHAFLIGKDTADAVD